MILVARAMRGRQSTTGLRKTILTEINAMLRADSRVTFRHYCALAWFRSRLVRELSR